MACNFPTDINSRLASFSANYAINSFMSGRITLNDCECIDGPGCGELCQTFSIGIDSNLETNCYEAVSYTHLTLPTKA